MKKLITLTGILLSLAGCAVDRSGRLILTSMMVADAGMCIGCGTRDAGMPEPELDAGALEGDSGFQEDAGSPDSGSPDCPEGQLFRAGRCRLGWHWETESGEVVHIDGFADRDGWSGAVQSSFVSLPAGQYTVVMRSMINRDAVADNNGPVVFTRLQTGSGDIDAEVAPHRDDYSASLTYQEFSASVTTVESNSYNLAVRQSSAYASAYKNVDWIEVWASD